MPSDYGVPNDNLLNDFNGQLKYKPVIQCINDDIGKKYLYSIATYCTFQMVILEKYFTTILQMKLLD